MPKNTLSRETATQEEKTYNAFSEGEQAFQDARPSSPQLQQSLGDDASVSPGTESLFHAGQNEVIFNSLTQPGRGIEHAFEMTITESMDMLYRTGEITIEDNRGFVELSNLVNTFEGENFEIILRNKYEEDKGRTFFFGLHGMKDQPWSNKTTYSLREEPHFTKYHKKLVNRSFVSKNANQIISEVLAEEGAFEKIRFIDNPDDPKLPSFVVPNWDLAKTVKYLSKYSAQGPIKVFNISREEDTVTMVAPLEKFITGQVYQEEYKIIPSTSEITDGAFKLVKWAIFGVNETDTINTLSGESVISFDYLAGDKSTDLESFAVEDYQHPNQNKEYGSVIGGSFKNGVGLVSNNLGNELFHKKDLKSEVEHKLSIDVDEKPLVQAKIQSRFRQSFHDEVMLYCILPGSTSVNVGQIFDVTLPSEIQPRDAETPNNQNDTLSGKWLLWKIVHKTKFVQSKVKYEMHCYFYRTGFNVSHDFRGVDKV